MNFLKEADIGEPAGIIANTFELCQLIKLARCGNHAGPFSTFALLTSATKPPRMSKLSVRPSPANPLTRLLPFIFVNSVLVAILRWYSHQPAFFLHCQSRTQSDSCPVTPRVRIPRCRSKGHQKGILSYYELTGDPLLKVERS